MLWSSDISMQGAASDIKLRFVLFSYIGKNILLNIIITTIFMSALREWWILRKSFKAEVKRKKWIPTHLTLSENTENSNLSRWGYM